MATSEDFQLECSSKLICKNGVQCVKCKKVVIRGIRTCPECQSWIHADCFKSGTDGIKFCWDAKCLQENDATPPPLPESRIECEVIEAVLNDLLNAKEIISVLKSINSDLENELVRIKSSADRYRNIQTRIETRVDSFQFGKPRFPSQRKKTRQVPFQTQSNVIFYPYTK